MLLTELIAQAQAALAEHGDMDVATLMGGCGCCPDELGSADTSVETVTIGVWNEQKTALHFLVT
ncbi:hypothetical protein [Streptomyces californicus]|uniref:hypothetical protein n=1 Tax=Streptomyces californicus TaxID=67351 RepID=UPI0037AA5D07